MFSLAEQVLQHEVTAPILILRHTFVCMISKHGPVEVMSQMLKRLALGEHVIEQRLQWLQRAPAQWLTTPSQHERP